jgi:hypothetical protein
MYGTGAKHLTSSLVGRYVAECSLCVKLSVYACEFLPVHFSPISENMVKKNSATKEVQKR